MKSKHSDLEQCIKIIEKDVKIGWTSPSAEIYAVNHLRKKSDILKFRNAYVQYLTKTIEQSVEQNKKRSSAVKLVNKGYAPEKVAKFFVHDALMFTLGHIHNQTALKTWYSALPYMKKGFPHSKEMYATVY